MNTIYKRFVAWVTKWQVNEFDRAVWRLTAYYTIGVMFVVLVFSIVIFNQFTRGINKHVRDMHERVELREFGESFADQLCEHTRNVIVLSDIGILIMTVLVSYALSRKTLQPLRINAIRQQRFVADSAHELRTPLAVIKAGGELILSRERSVADYQKFIQESLDEVDRLVRMSNSLLELSTTKTTLPSEPLSVTQSINDTVSKMRAYAESKNITIAYDSAQPLWSLISADHMTRLMTNLITNAIDYNNPGGSVTVTTIKKHSKIIITVADTGMGIAESDLPHIFDRFYTADSARTHAGVSGTGLGLAIVADIVARYHGRIDIDSKVGVGTTFTIELPALCSSDIHTSAV